MLIEKHLEKLNNTFYKIVSVIEESLQKKELTDEFFLIDLKEFDNEIIKVLALYHPQGEFLRETIAYLKITSFLYKIKKSVKSFIKKYKTKNDKIDALYQNALSSITTLKLAINSENIEDAYSTIISYEKIADDIYKELVKDIKKIEDIDEILKTLNIAKKLERITDSVKTISKYLLFAKEGVDI